MTDLTATEIEAPEAALDDQYHACSTCELVIRDSGEVRPFINMRDASHARHLPACQRCRSRVRGSRHLSSPYGWYDPSGRATAAAGADRYRRQRRVS